MEAESHGDGSFGTGLFTGSAADAFHVVGFLINGEFHLAGSLASTAFDAFALVDPDPVKGYRIKETVDRSQWAKVPAEGSPKHHREDDQYDEDRQLQRKQAAYRHTQSFIRCQHGQTRKEGP